MTQALVIEDDAVTAHSIASELQAQGYQVRWESTGRDGLAAAIAGGHDIITLDRMLPDFDGLTIVSTLRGLGITTPVLMLSALSDVDERVRGLRCGGDDYLTKPFSLVEMVARLEALLRRPAAQTASHQLKVGELTLDLIDNTLTRADEAIALLPTEFKILTYLMRNAGQLVTRTMLFEQVWGEPYIDNNNTVMAHIGRLREKLHEPPRKPKFVKTVWGVGYIIEK